MPTADFECLSSTFDTAIDTAVKTYGKRQLDDFLAQKNPHVSGGDTRINEAAFEQAQSHV